MSNSVISDFTQQLDKKDSDTLQTDSAGTKWSQYAWDNRDPKDSGCEFNHHQLTRGNLTPLLFDPALSFAYLLQQRSVSQPSSLPGAGNGTF